jgi:RNA polymerase sigma-70 factor (ECF subfamily)
MKDMESMTQIREWTPTASGVGSRSGFTDEELMEMIQAHDHNGLDLLFERYAMLLKGLSMTVLHNVADAEDLLQDIFVEIWDRAASYSPQKGRPLSWIATLTRRRSIDRLRRRETHYRVENRFAEETKGCNDGWTHVHEEIAEGEINQHLRRALATLPEAQRSAIKLAYHEEMTQREIAARTGIPLGTIKTRLELGLRKLAACLCGFEDLLWAGNRAAGGQNIT